MFWNDADRLAERLALLDVLDRHGDRGLRRRHAGDRDAEALLREVVDHLAEALALGDEQVLDRHARVVEEELRRVLRVHADLLEVAAALEARRVALDDEHADALVALRRVGLDRGHEQVAVDAVRDERLRAVDDVVVAVADRLRLDAGEVGPGAGLGHRDRGDERAVGDARQPALLLLLVAVLEEVRQADVVVQRQADAEAAERQAEALLAEDDVEAEVVDPRSAVLVRHLGRDEPVARRRRRRPRGGRCPPAPTPRSAARPRWSASGGRSGGSPRGRPRRSGGGRSWCRSRSSRKGRTSQPAGAVAPRRDDAAAAARPRHDADASRPCAACRAGRRSRSAARRGGAPSRACRRRRRGPSAGAPGAARAAGS